jgi:iron complex outermembrane receptor protein
MHIVRSSCLLSSVAIVSTLAVPPAHAQDESTSLAPIVLEGSGDIQDPTAPISGYVARSSASGTKTGTPLVETQQSVSVITADQIEAQGVSTLGEVLDYTPGVSGEPYGADPRFDSPNIRGFDGRQSQFLNGLKLMRTSGAPAVEVYGLERVEVLRGPASVLYGQGNPGGLVNLVSKRPTFDPLHEVGIQVGSYDYYGTSFDFSDQISGSDFAYRLTGVLRNAGAQTDELQNDRYYIAPAFSWKPDEDKKLTILTSVQHDNPDSPSGLPYELTLGATANRLPRDFYIGGTDIDDSSRTLTNIGYEFEHRFDDVWSFRQNFRYSNFDWDYTSVYFSSLAGDGHTLNRGVIY